MSAYATLIVLALAAPPALASETGIEAWAAALVDHPEMTTGNRDALVASWLGAVAAEPGHPLVEASLVMLGQVGALADPEAASHALAALDITRMRPPAASLAARLTAREGQRRAPADDLPADPWSDVLRHWALLGPLPPLGHPLHPLEADTRLTAPELDAEHAGLHGAQTWRAWERRPQSRALRVRDEFERAAGRGLLAVAFEVPRAGSGWIEIDTGDGAGAMDSLAFSVDGGPVRLLDRWRERLPRHHREAVGLAAGSHRIVFAVSLDGDPTLAVRVLDAEGAPWPGLRHVPVLSGAIPSGTDTPPPAPDTPPPAPASPPPAPARAFPDVEAFLAAIEQPGPATQVLRGLLLANDGRGPEGLADVREGVERDPSHLGSVAILSHLLDRAAHLPAVTRRSESRRLAEEVLAAEPSHLGMGLAVADVMSGEHREEEALALLDRLDALYPKQVRTLLQKQRVLASLGMEGEADQVLALMSQRSPLHPSVLSRLVEHEERHGFLQRGLAHRSKLLRILGASPVTLSGLARAYEVGGHPDQARALLREALARGAPRSTALGLARVLVRSDMPNKARVRLKRLAAEHPAWIAPRLELADQCLTEGRRDRELAWLAEVVDLQPGHMVARQRLAALTGHDPLEVWFDRYEVDPAEILAGHDEQDHDASVVRVLDHQIVVVLPDGGIAMQTHEIRQPRDLDGCEREGRRRFGGEVLHIAINKADGRQLEPVRVDDEYVLPQLEPGDLIETVERSHAGAGPIGTLRLGKWFFESTIEPYHLSRYVVVVPEGLELSVHTGGFDGQVEQRHEDGHVVHIYEAHRRKRIIPEPAMPPRHWIAPWVEFGQAEPGEAALAARLTAPLLPLVRLTPELRRAAADVVDGIAGDETRARELHRFVSEHVDQRQPFSSNSATEVLVAREGNAAFLFAALLEAADVPRELVWSRDISPQADGDASPTFLEDNWVQRKLYVLVRPRDGETAWCDMDSRTLPYGTVVRDAPDAPCFGTGGSGFFTRPHHELDRHPGTEISMSVHVAADGSASVTGSARMTGGLGFPYKEQIENIPTEYHRYVIAQGAAMFVPGIDVTGFEVQGLEDPEIPISVTVSGTVAQWLDRDAGRLVRPWPFPPLGLSARFGGEGRRRLPFFLGSVFVERMAVDMHVPAGLDIPEPPVGLALDLPTGRYDLSIRPGEPDEDGARTWHLRRDLLMGPMSLDTEHYEAFMDLCARIDEAERARLRFESVGVP